MTDAPIRVGPLRWLGQRLCRVRGWAFGVLVAVPTILVLLAAVFYLLLIPRLDFFRPYVTQALDQMFVKPVEMRGMRLTWDWGPSLHLDRMQVGSRSDPQLSLHDVNLRLFALPLLWGKAMARDLQIGAGSLQAVQNPSGGWQIAGLKPGHGLAQPELDLNGAHIHIQHVTVILHLAQRVEPLRIHLNGYSSGGLRPQMRVHLRWAGGGQMDYSSGVVQTIFTQPGQSSEDGHWKLQALPLAYLSILDNRFPNVQGKLDASGTVQWQSGLPRHALVHFQIHHPVFAGQPLRRLSGNLSWNSHFDSGVLQLLNVKGLTKTPLRATLRGQWRHDAQWQFSAPELPVQIIRYLPVQFLPPEWRHFPQTQWQGSLRHLQFTDSESGIHSGPHWQLQVQLHDLRIPTDNTTLGLQGISGHLQVRPNDFLFALRSPRMTLDWPTHFAQPLNFLNVSAVISGRKQAAQWLFKVHSMRLNGPGQLQAQATLTGRKLALQAYLENMPVVDIAHFVPLTGIRPSLRRWLLAAFQQGTLSQAHLSWVGPWNHLPRKQQGEHFSLLARFHGVNLHYAQGWPEVTHLDTLLQWSGHHLTLSSHHGEIAGIPVAEARLMLNNLGAAHTSPLQLQIHTPVVLNQVLPFLQKTPIARNASWAKLPLQFSGHGQLHLGLIIPFGAAKAKVNGRLDLQSVGMNWSGWKARHISGQIAFQRHSLRTQSLQGNFAGGPVQARLEMHDRSGVHPGLQLKLHGTLQTQSLPLPILWRSALHGVVPYEASGNLRHGILQLQGIAHLQRSLSTLPAPLDWGYTQDGTVTLNGRGHLSQGLNLTLRAPMGSAALHWVHESQHWRWRTGVLHLGPGATPAMPQRGWVVDGQGNNLPVDAWLKLFTSGQDSALLPQIRLNLHWQQVHLLGQYWQDTQMQGDYTKGIWYLHWRSPQSVGALTYQKAQRLGLPATVAMNIQHLNIDTPVAIPAVAAPTTSSASITTAPSWASGSPLVLQTRIAQLDWHGHSLSKVLLNAQRSPMGWNISALKGRWANSDWDLVGQWHAHDENTTTFQGRIHSHNIAPILEDFGMRSLEYGQATYDGQLSWPGAPWDFTLKTVTGKVHSILKNGRLKKIGTQVSWLVFLNPTTLLKDLLTFDYRPLFGDGLFFSKLSAHFDLAQGLARTSDLSLKSSALAMSGQGAFNLSQRSMDLNLQVYPLQSFDWLLGHFPLLGPALFGDSGKVLEWHYHAGGSWAHPVLTQLHISAPAQKDH